MQELCVFGERKLLSNKNMTLEFVSFTG